MTRVPHFGLGLALLLAAGQVRADDTVVVHRCVDGKGQVTLQDDPCPPGAQDTTLRLQRPQDPPPRPVPAPAPAPAPVVAPTSPPPPPPPPAPPPPMYRCTSYDGIVRLSESYDPNPRCEPLGLYYPPGYLTPKSARMCRWVEDSCVRLSDEEACEVWHTRLREAQSAVLRAFSDTAAYRKSELERISRIVSENCP